MVKQKRSKSLWAAAKKLKEPSCGASFDARCLQLEEFLIKLKAVFTQKNFRIVKEVKNNLWCEEKTDNDSPNNFAHNNYGGKWAAYGMHGDIEQQRKKKSKGHLFSGFTVVFDPNHKIVPVKRSITSRR